MEKNVQLNHDDTNLQPVSITEVITDKKEDFPLDTMLVGIWDTLKWMSETLKPLERAIASAYDLVGAAIVAKSLHTTGYIKYANGLIIQWGAVKAFDSGDGVNTWLSKSLPISFSNGGYSILVANASNTSGEIRITPTNSSTYSISRSSTSLIYYSFIAIGY